jgi:hypothetical protein
MTDDHRAHIGACAMLAGYRAHKADMHAGDVDGSCLTCSRYLLGILTAPSPAPRRPADPTP